MPRVDASNSSQVSCAFNFCMVQDGLKKREVTTAAPCSTGPLFFATRSFLALVSSFLSRLLLRLPRVRVTSYILKPARTSGNNFSAASIFSRSSWKGGNFGRVDLRSRVGCSSGRCGEKHEKF